MNDPPVSPPDDVEAFLRPPPPFPGAERLRQSLLQETTRLVRRRRRLKRLALAGALAACYMAGVLTMRLGMASAPPPETDLVQKPGGKEKEKEENPSREPPPRKRPP